MGLIFTFKDEILPSQDEISDAVRAALKDQGISTLEAGTIEVSDGSTKYTALLSCNYLDTDYDVVYTSQTRTKANKPENPLFDRLGVDRFDGYMGFLRSDRSQPGTIFSCDFIGDKPDASQIDLLVRTAQYLIGRLPQLEVIGVVYNVGKIHTTIRIDRPVDYSRN